MSIVTDITRIMNAKADIKAAIEEKGVEVGDGLIDTYAGKIAEITGGDSYYDTFWDAHQQNGKRTDYHYAFAGVGWTDEVFYPKYDIKPVQFINTFSRTRMRIDLAQRLEDCGVKLDLSIVGNSPQFALYDTHFTRYPDLDFSRCINLTDTIANCPYLEEIDSITFNSNLGLATRLFNNCPALKHIREVKGTIPIDMNFKTSTELTPDSMKNIINALDDYSDPTYAGYFTITFSDNCWEALEASGGVPDDYDSWKNYVEIEKGWLT